MVNGAATNDHAVEIREHVASIEGVVFDRESGDGRSSVAVLHGGRSDTQAAAVEVVVVDVIVFVPGEPSLQHGNAASTGVEEFTVKDVDPVDAGVVVNPSRRVGSDVTVS